MGTIKINGLTIETIGGCVSLCNNKLIVDGDTIDVGDNHNVIIHGDVKELKVVGKVTVNGTVHGICNSHWIDSKFWMKIK